MAQVVGPENLARLGDLSDLVRADGDARVGPIEARRKPGARPQVQCRVPGLDEPDSSEGDAEVFDQAARDAREHRIEVEHARHFESDSIERAGHPARWIYHATTGRGVPRRAVGASSHP